MHFASGAHLINSGGAIHQSAPNAVDTSSGMLFDNNSGTYSIDGDYNFNNNGCCVTGALTISNTGTSRKTAGGSASDLDGTNRAHEDTCTVQSRVAIVTR